MAVYTKLVEQDINNILSNYSIGKLKSFKEIQEGIVIAFCKLEGKVGVAVGVTSKLIDKYDAVIFVKEAAEILGGKGGGGRKDFAQAGGISKDKIDEAYKALRKKIS